MQNYPSLSSRRPRGFSLVELLIVIVVLGALASIAIANFGNVDEHSRINAAKAQAQRIASVFGAGRATGAPGFVPANSVSAAMNAVGAGSPGAGSMRGSFFHLPGISAEMDASLPEEHQARYYLSWQSGMLSYNPTGGGPEAGNEENDREAWLAAFIAARTAFSQANPDASQQELQDFLHAWIAAHPPPGQPNPNHLT